MSTTPIQYLLLNAVSVCYSPYYFANFFLKKEIAQVIEIRTHHNTNISVLDEDPQFWYQKCTQSVLLQVRWMDTEAAFKFIQSIRDAKVVVNETLWYEDDEPKTVVVYPTETSQPWFVLEGNLNNFHYEYPRHIIWTNPEYQVNINKKYHQDEDYNIDEDYDANDTPGTVIGKAYARYMQERAQCFGEDDEFERRMDDDDE